MDASLLRLCFELVFVLLLKHASGCPNERIYMHRKSDSKLFNLDRLSRGTWALEILVRDMLFAAVLSHTEEDCQRLADFLSLACLDFGLTIYLKKTNFGSEEPHVISINNHALEVVCRFMYHGPTNADKVSLEPELNKHIVRASTTLPWFRKRMEQQTDTAHLSKAYSVVPSACSLGGESRTLFIQQVKRPSSLYMRCLRHVLGCS